MSGINTFEDFQAMESSEKEGLVVLEAAKRLMGWVLHSGSIYKITSFDHPVLSPDSPVKDSGVALTLAASVVAMTAGSYFYDRTGKVLYLRTSDSVNPNGKFISCVFRLFFSKSGRNLPSDLNSGFDVHWLALLKDTSQFGVEIDNQNQLGSAIEGTGSLKFFNDQDFWGPIYDKYYFENQRVFVYSWNPFLPITEASLIYRGRVQKKTWTATEIGFDLQDILNELRAPVTLSYLSDLPGIRIPDSMSFAFQRRLYGYVLGHRPTNIDQVLDGYLITGTIATASGSASIVGTGTAFLSELSPDDEITIFDSLSPRTFSIDSITDDTHASLSEVYDGSTSGGVTVKVKPANANRKRNRIFLIAGHPLCRPSTTVVSALTTSMIQVASVMGLRPGDPLIVAGQSTAIIRISGNILKLSTSLSSKPNPGDSVLRPAVTNVYLNDQLLVEGPDYTYDAAASTVTLDPLAEFNVASPKTLRGTVSFTNGSRSIVGTGTTFTTDLNAGDWIKANGQSAYFEVLSVDDDTHVSLRAAATYTANLAGVVKRPDYYIEGGSILSCDTLGATDNGTSAGNLLCTAPQIVEDLLLQAGLGALVDSASFAAAKDLTGKRLGLAIPKKFGDKTAPTIRDTINSINKSDFGSMVQSNDFMLQFHILSPDRASTLTRFAEADALAFAIQSDSNNIVKTSRVRYDFREVDPIARAAINSEEVETSDTSQYLANATKEFALDTLLIDQEDAVIYARRWAFLFEMANSVVKIGTKLQGSRLQIGDRIELSHEKMYQRLGSSARRKVAAVSAAKRSLTDSSLELDDLSNAFSRCAVIADDTAADYSAAPEQERAVTGYITDDYGMQSNDPETFGTNLIW
jgi:hypothetical protein